MITFLIMVSAYLLLLAILSGYLRLHKTEIISKIEKEIQSRFPGRTTIKSATIGIGASFPDIEIELNDVRILDTLYQEPMLAMERVDILVGFRDLFRKELTINSLEFYNGSLHIFSDSSGYSNSYLLKIRGKPSGEQSKTFPIRDISLQGVKVLIENSSSRKRIELYVRKLDAGIRWEDPVYQLSLEESCLVNGLGFDLSKGIYLENREVNGSWGIRYDPGKAAFSFSGKKTTIGQQLFQIGGEFQLKDSAGFSLDISSQNLRYEFAENLLPVSIRKSLDLFQADQPFDVHAWIKGPLAPGRDPWVKVQWSTRGNRLKTPYFSLENCSLSGSFTNENVKGLPRGDPNSAVVIRNLRGTWGSLVLSGKQVVVTNLKNPVMQFELDSYCTFPQLDETLSLNNIQFVSGNAWLYLQYAGPFLTDASLLKKLKIKLHLRNGVLTYLPRSLTFNSCNGDLLFSDNILQTSLLSCNLKQNHFNVTVTAKDVATLSHGTRRKANITCSVTSHYINLSDFSGLLSEKQKIRIRKSEGRRLPALAFNIDELLADGDLHLRIRADKVLKDHFEAVNIKADLVFHQNDWQVQHATFGNSGGTVELSGNVLHRNGKELGISAGFSLRKVDLAKLFYGFDDFGQSSLTSGNLKGIADTHGKLSVGISSSGSFLPGSLSGDIDFSIKKGALINFEPLEKIKKYIFRNRDLSNIRFGDLSDHLEIRNGDIHISRMHVQSSALSFYLDGIYSLSNTHTDLSIQVPFRNLASRKDFNPADAGGNNDPAGPSLFLRLRSGQDGNLKFGVDLFKKFRKSSDPGN